MKANRILIKLSGEALSDGTSMFAYDKIATLAKHLFTVAQSGKQLAVVCGAGNIRRYRDTKDAGIDRVKSDHLGMMGTVMNAVMLNEKYIQAGGKGIVACAKGMHISPLTTHYNALTARHKMIQGTVVFCAGGTGNPYSTTDLGAVLRALELQCEILIKVTKVDGVYDKDPHLYSDAKRFDALTLAQADELNLHIMDHSAIGMARENKLAIFVCHIDQLAALANGTAKGTMVTPE